VIDWTPTAIAIQLGPIPVYWYGVAYAVGLLAVYFVATRVADYYHLDRDYIGNGMVVIGIAALIGGRAYHVIDQFQLYKDDLLKIVLPPYTGLGVYGGIVTGLIAFVFLIRRWHQDLWTWADVVAPAIFVMQAFGRWGNFFNQELYGPPTNLPWGIAIDCAHRVAAYPCDLYPLATTHFAPLFLYESLSGFVGATVLVWLASKPRPSLRRGDLLPIGLIWYAIVRFVLEFLRTGNWKLEGIATAQLFSIGFVVLAGALLVYRHRTAPSSEMVGVPPIDEDAASGSTVRREPSAGSADPEPLT
jgi:phosphatidylglycerol---prolipoprotein diacylglyceryl transferase